MQAAQIKIGDHYAVTHDYRDKSMRVVELRTSKTGAGVKSYAVGYTPADATGEKAQKIIVPVKDVIGELRSHEKLQAERLARDQERKAQEQEREDKQHKAIKLLADLIGAQAVTAGKYSMGASYDKDKPAVLAYHHSIELNEPAIDALIKVLGPDEEYDPHADVGIDSTYEVGG